jgi:hypothetical protein
MLQESEGKDGYKDTNCITVINVLKNVKQNPLQFLADVKIW